MKTKTKWSGELPEVEQLRAELHRVRFRARYLQVLRATLERMLVSAAAVILAATLWLPVLSVTGTSMAPNLQAGDVIVCFRTEAIRPGETVAFYVGNRLLIKRCIAGPGQTVDVQEDGTVVVDRTELEEPYLSEKTKGQWDVELPFTVPQGQLFCLGDNRAVSVDSRSSAVGCISREQICGKLLLRIWPLSRFGPVE